MYDSLEQRGHSKSPLYLRLDMLSNVQVRVRVSVSVSSMVLQDWSLSGKDVDALRSQ